MFSYFRWCRSPPMPNCVYPFDFGFYVGFKCLFISVFKGDMMQFTTAYTFLFVLPISYETCYTDDTKWSKAF